MIEFKPWGKTPRLFRDIIVTEKIDGTNAAVIVQPVKELIGDAASFCEGLEYAKQWCSKGVTAWVTTEDGTSYAVAAQSRKRLIIPGDDNFGFAAWVADHAEALVRALGAGHHFGEWWGKGIQRGYDRDGKRFSLFNVDRYTPIFAEGDLDAALALDDIGLGIVPELYRGPLSEEALNMVDLGLRTEGSQVAPGYMDPEGFITFHSASRQVYKTLLENDPLPKGLAA